VGGFLRRLVKYGTSLVSVSDLSWFAYPSYLVAHSLASLGGMLHESKSGNNGLCSGSDLKTVGAVDLEGVVSVGWLKFRDVSEIARRVWRSLEFLAMMVGWDEEDGKEASERSRASHSVVHCSPKTGTNILMLKQPQTDIVVATLKAGI